MTMYWPFVIVISACCAAYLVTFYFRIYRREQKMNATYPLFKVRDEILIHLVKENIDENSLVMTFLYKNVNTVLKYREFVCMRNLLFAETNPEVARKFDELLEEISHRPPELAKVVDDFFTGFRRLLATNSISVQLMLFADMILPIRLILKTVLFILTKCFKPTDESYIGERIISFKTYKRYGEYENRTRQLYAAASG